MKVEDGRVSNAPKNMALITTDQENRHTEFSSASFLLLRPEMNLIAIESGDASRITPN